MHETVGTQIKKSEKISDNHLMPFDFRFFLCPNCGMCVLLASVVGSGGGSSPSSIPHSVGSSTYGVLRSPYSGAVRWSRLSLFIIAISPPLPPLLLLLPSSAAFSSSSSSLLFLSTVSSYSCDYWHLVHGCSSPVLSTKDFLYYSSPTAELLHGNPTFACCRRRLPLLLYSLVSSISLLS